MWIAWQHWFLWFPWGNGHAWVKGCNGAPQRTLHRPITLQTGIIKLTSWPLLSHLRIGLLIHGWWVIVRPIHIRIHFAWGSCRNGSHWLWSTHSNNKKMISNTILNTGIFNRNTKLPANFINYIFLLLKYINIGLNVYFICNLIFFWFYETL